MLHRSHYLFFVCLAVTGTATSALFGCATPGDRRSRYETAQPAPEQVAGVTPQESAEYREILKLYQAVGPAAATSPTAAYKNTFDRARLFRKTYPRSPLTAQVENIQGLAFLLSQRPKEAIPHFKKAIEVAPDPERFVPYVYYNLAKAQYESGLVADASVSLSRVSVEALDKDNQVKFHYLRARVYLKKSAFSDAASEILQGSRSASQTGVWTPEIRGAYIGLLDPALAGIKELSELNSLTRGYEGSPLLDSVIHRLGVLEAEQGLTAEARAHANQILTQYPSSPYRDWAAQFAQAAPAVVKRSRTLSRAEPYVIGVLLPMKGKFQELGDRALQAIEVALGIFETGKAASKYTLIVEDSGEEPDQTVRAVNRLVYQHHVTAIIGPLLSKGIDQVAARADELGVPLLSLSRFPGTALDYNIPFGLTLKSQAYEAARLATQVLGLRSFAIMHPRDKLGEETAQAFWDAVEEFGGQIVGIESYNPGETDFRIPVDKLSGLFYTEARQAELDALAKAREANKITKRTRKTQQYFDLPPIVNYEAVFIPDEPRVSGQIIPTFAYRDVDKTKFLGTSAWNSADFISRTQGYWDRIYFVDAYSSGSTNPLAKSFREKYSAQFETEPTSMEALAYDAARVLDLAVNQSGGGADRERLLEKIHSIDGFPGVTGRIALQERNSPRKLKLFTVKDGKVAETGSGG